MNNKQKRKAVHDYQFVVYTPQEKIYVRTGDNVYEISGHVYPYRKKKFDYTWLEVFHKQ